MIRQGNKVLTPQQIADLIRAFSMWKAEEDDLLVNHPDSIFVPTQAYRRVEGKNKSLVVGRKGVGKSAVAQIYLKLTEEKFSEAVALQADALMFERICNLLSAGKEAHAELLVSSDRVSYVSWMRSIVFFATTRACDWCLEYCSGLSENDRATLLGAKQYIDRELGYSVADSHGLFHALIEKTLGFLSELSGVLTAADDERARIRGEQLNQFFEPYPPEVEAVLAIIERSGFTLLITLDEFDDFIDSYMQTSPSVQRRNTLLDLFKGLVIAIRKLNRKKNLRWLHLLIAVPEDKLLELRLREGAAVDQIAFEIKWTLRELKDCVERRLTHVLSSSTKWEDLFGFLVSNKNLLVKTKEESFSYLVRHTNRKPRELMTYLQAIFDAIGSEGRAADERLFQKVVESTAERIVELQFLPEYQSEYPTLDRLLNKLRTRRLRTVMSLGDVDHFRGWKPWDSEEALNPADTLVRLFQMGIVGIRETCPVENARTVRQGGANVIYHFSFNGSSTNFFYSAIKDLSEQENQGPPSNLHLVFNPMFFEYLRVQHDQPYIINQVI